MLHTDSAATIAASRSWRAALMATWCLLLPTAASAQESQRETEPDLSELIAPTTERPPFVPPPSCAHVIRTPEYRDGGFAGMVRTIYQHTKWPASPMLNAQYIEEGKVWVEFDVGSDGKVYDARVAVSLRPDFDKEALKGVKALGEFIPGVDATGRPATITMAVPVEFKIR
ncbi:energy transducer TonB [Hymenobacter sp. DH14]|uniref:Energy transducer TonB n=1 Tax=Hymenobacter cyanobacteriorum TaxID=2926463 RepID=A0A9X2AGB6_9BACT|nr:energy transducer TonB [Hymenobacter cyanobacteriorum]MCI1188677.1 energy transducer TonB [Hymenobacter cyanobacteriorum]